MSSRGRFSSRGGSSYRGGGRGESSYRGSRGGGGGSGGAGYSTSRGYSGSRGRGSYYPKYETSSSKYSTDSGTRYSSHTRMDEPSYRKPESYGSSRDHSHHRSDIDMGRKRMRSDSYSQNQGSTGSRRSHEMEDYRGSGSRYMTSNSYTDSRSYSENRGVFKKPRLSDNFKSKEEYRGRKEASRSTVPATKLRSFRGRYIRGRAILRRGGDSFLSRKRAVFSSSKTSELLALRRKMLKLRRFRDRAKLRVPEEKKKESKGLEESTGQTSDLSASDFDGQNGVEKKTEETETKSEEKKEKAKVKKEGEACDGESEYREKEKPKKSEERGDFFRRSFMKLQCPQCSMKCVTFKQYSLHLYHPTHAKAMKQKSQQLKQSLAAMRIAQRARQKKMDEEDLTSMSTKFTFCFICKLSYSQDKSVHQTSDAHKKLKNFLQPYCTVCRISFKSPMSYERHLCSLDHMKKKNILDERLGKTKGSSMEYLDNYMVLDSVGSGDEVEDSKDEKTEETIKSENKSGEEDEDDINIGVEFIRKVEAFYCEVCRFYLPRLADEEKALRTHCRTQNHYLRYLRFGNSKLLQQIQNKKLKEESEKAGDEKTEVKTEDGAKESENHEDGVDDEDKLWADVTDLLSQVEPEAKSDDEDEEEGGRFDRFRSNEKKENGEVSTTEEGIADKESDGGVAETAVKQVAEEAM
ncbi:hypothetical protein RUM43_002927 [Polyplax serrata]|uniref:C2H2-type domain-containing protein n=1 Tax=Polyplax serrata TaxID=468196 RepID=A0AAN8P2S1_POLSC